MMNAPPFPRNPSMGQYFGNWVWSGSRWVCASTAGIRTIITTFPASAPYTPSPGLVTTVVETIGGGGGGGGCFGTAGSVGGGGGGASGGYSRSALPAAMVAGGVNVTVGAGGLGNVDPSSGAAGLSFPGGATTFGALCAANGGGGGQSNNGPIGGVLGGDPGVAGPPGVGDLTVIGNPGGPGGAMASTAEANPIMFVVGGSGGAIMGGGAPEQLCPPGVSIPGTPGLGAGAGGAGAAVNELAVDVPGGTGGSGLCIVTEYCWADAVDDGCGCGTTGGARVAITGPQNYGGWDGND